MFFSAQNLKSKLILYKRVSQFLSVIVVSNLGCTDVLLATVKEFMHSSVYTSHNYVVVGVIRVIDGR